MRITTTYFGPAELKSLNITTSGGLTTYATHCRTVRRQPPKLQLTHKTIKSSDKSNTKVFQLSQGQGNTVIESRKEFAQQKLIMSETFIDILFPMDI